MCHVSKILTKPERQGYTTGNSINTPGERELTKSKSSSPEKKKMVQGSLKMQVKATRCCPEGTWLLIQLLGSTQLMGARRWRIQHGSNYFYRTNSMLGPL